MFRKIVSIIAGILAGAMVFAASLMISAEFHPSPQRFNIKDPIAIAAHVRLASHLTLFVLLSGWMMAGFVAGFVSTVVSADHKKQYALLCAAVFMALTIYSRYSEPTPIWFWIIGLLLWAPFTLLGRRIITG